MEQLEKIFETTCHMRGYTVEQVLKKTKQRDIVYTRQMYMHFAWERNLATLEKIGAACGRDHATVLHSHKSVVNMLETDKGFRNEYRQIEAELLKHCERKKIVDVTLDDFGFDCFVVDNVVKAVISVANEACLIVSALSFNTIEITLVDGDNEIMLRTLTYFDELEKLYEALSGKQLEKCTQS